MRKLEVGDLFRAYVGGSIWFVEIADGQVCKGRCAKEGETRVYAFGALERIGEDVSDTVNIIARNVTSFEHAVAIAALLS